MPRYGQPAISRETRLLLVTVVVSLAALWVLARIRFQDRPVTAAPVAPVLAQLRPESTYDDLARSLSQIRPAVAAAIVPAAHRVAALRVGSEVGISVSAATLALVKLRHGEVPSINPWNPRIMNYPRYLVAVDAFDEGISLRPVFVGTLSSVESPIWNGSIWRLPPNVNLPSGTFVFTTDGSLAGVAVDDAGLPALLPPTALMDAATRLLEESPRVAAGQLGIQVRPTSLGLAIAWVDPNGPGAGHVTATDIVEAVDGQRLLSVDQWTARTARIGSGDIVALRVRSGNNVRDVQIAATPVVEPAEDPTLGLRLRTLPGIGAEVAAVQPRSRGDRAGIQERDVITMIRGEKTPTAALVRKAFEETPEKGKLLVAITRGNTYEVAVLEK